MTKSAIKRVPNKTTLKAMKDAANGRGLTAYNSVEDFKRKRNIEKATGSLGAWKDRKGKSVDMVNELRKDERRKYADRIRRH